jgi:hypothetical protein
MLSKLQKNIDKQNGRQGDGGRGKSLKKVASFRLLVPAVRD